MRNKALVQQTRHTFENLAQDLTEINRHRAQALYEEMFVTHSQFPGTCKEGFHVGELHCDRALIALDIHRHPSDNHLAVRGEFKVMEVTQ